MITGEIFNPRQRNLIAKVCQIWGIEHSFKAIDPFYSKGAWYKEACLLLKIYENPERGYTWIDKRLIRAGDASRTSKPFRFVLDYIKPEISTKLERNAEPDEIRIFAFVTRVLVEMLNDTGVKKEWRETKKTLKKFTNLMNTLEKINEIWEKEG